MGLGSYGLNYLNERQAIKSHGWGFNSLWWPLAFIHPPTYLTGNLRLIMRIKIHAILVSPFKWCANVVSIPDVTSCARYSTLPRTNSMYHCHTLKAPTYTIMIHKVDTPYSLVPLIRMPIFDCMWFGVALRIDTKKTCAQNMINKVKNQHKGRGGAQ